MRVSDFTGEEIIPGQESATAHVQDGPEGEVVGNNWLMPVVLIALVALLTVRAGFGALAIVVGFLFVIFMHELGHFLTARAAGMKVTQFFLGLGPTLWSFQRGEVEYGLKAIPLGAFVRIIGMNNLDPVDPAEEHRAYRQAPYWRRMSVVLAGSAMHFLMAFVALLGLHSLVGWQGPSEADPVPERWAIDEVMADGAALGMGFLAGDQVVSVDGYEIKNFNELAFIVRESADQAAEFVVERNDQLITLSGTIGSILTEEGVTQGSLGVRKGSIAPDRKGVGSSIVTSVKDFGVFTKDSINGILGIPGFLLEKLGLVDDVEPQLGTEGTGEGGSGDPLSVVGIVRAGDTFVDFFGWTVLGGLFVAVNIFLGMFNLVPLLPFDGGHAAVATYERLRSTRERRHFVDVAKLLPITYATIAVLMVLMGITVYNDIFNFTLFDS